ncbi:hypothetical protein GCM10010394_60720 [Streptomyces crystallinus]|uniref:Uncharacterized protein n=1 Tax=Streptomyces crystallinus TaxID=68191 RepID=A0ABP3RZH2_9ACTN
MNSPPAPLCHRYRKTSLASPVSLVTLVKRAKHVITLVTPDSEPNEYPYSKMSQRCPRLARMSQARTETCQDLSGTPFILRAPRRRASRSTVAVPATTATRRAAMPNA